jgi:hypothetical protein
MRFGSPESFPMNCRVANSESTRARAYVVGALIVLAACEAKGPSAPQRSLAPPDAVPASVALDAAAVVVGMATGTLRTTAHVDSFRIGQTPVTVGYYKRCVDAGVCGPRPSIGEEPPDAVQLLTSVDDARHYCEWVGGDLPRVAEWVYAARGPAVHRFPWGDVVGTCNESGRVSLVGETSDACCGAPCANALVTNAHPGGRSPAGVADVLAFPRELIARGVDGAASMCRADACVVTGFIPGAMDVVTPVSAATDFSFRCAWRDSQ